MRHAGVPFPHLYKPIHRYRPQTRNFRDTSKRYYSPYSHHYRSYDYKTPLHSPGRRDINQSNRFSMTIAYGMPEYEERSHEQAYSYPKPYNNNPYENPSEYEQCRPRMEFENEHIHYPPSYQSEPRIKPGPYTDNEDWEEYQSYFEDGAELSRWDPRSKLLILAASLKGQARTYYMSLDTCDK